MNILRILIIIMLFPFIFVGALGLGVTALIMLSPEVIVALIGDAYHWLFKVLAKKG